MKTIYNFDRIRLCLLQPTDFYDNLYTTYHSEPKKKIEYDGFFLYFKEDEDVNDKDITARLFVDVQPPVELGTFTFNKSRKYGERCFFEYSTRVLYQVANSFIGANGQVENSNFFTFPFFAFDDLGLRFNNVTHLEVTCDTEANIMCRIQKAVSKPDVFNMILCGKKVKSPEEILDGYWEYYQRSRLRKAPRPTLYIHSLKQQVGNRIELKIYDKARELVQSRDDREVLYRAWNGMNNSIQRMEVTLENKTFKQFFKQVITEKPNGWNLPYDYLSTLKNNSQEYREALRDFLFFLGLDEMKRREMFIYFSDHLLHFKLRNKEKTQVPLVAFTEYTTEQIATLIKRKRKSNNTQRSK